MREWLANLLLSVTAIRGTSSAGASGGYAIPTLMWAAVIFVGSL
jgi:hypothetical protein